MEWTSRFGLPKFRDLSAGLINGVMFVPDGLASGALAGVNPVHGLYTSIVAPIIGSSLASTQRMQIVTTSAAAIAAGEAVAQYPEADRASAVFLLALMCGVIMLAGALLGVGRLLRYVSQSVMSGLLLGIAVVLIMDQLPQLFGYDADGPNKPAKTLDLAWNILSSDPRTTLIGLSALAIAYAIKATPLRHWSSVVALIVPTVAMLALDWGDTVRQVSDVSPIAGGFPPLSLPAFQLINPQLIAAAATLSIVIMVQGAGVGQSIVNADGRPTDSNRDIFAEGAANVAVGLFSGIPAGGSVGQSALNVDVGAKTRWAGIFGALWVLFFVLVIPGVVSLVPMSVLAALMIVAGISALDYKEARSIWSVGWLPRIATAVTFLTCLFYSITSAVLVGAVLTAVMALRNAEQDVRVRRISNDGSGGFIESDPPDRLTRDDGLVVLDVFGSLFFAGARALAEKLPDIGDAGRPAVVIRMRGYIRTGVTLVVVLDAYADELAKRGGKLYLSGLSPQLIEQFQAALRLNDGSDPELFAAAAKLGWSTQEAARQAFEWRSARTRPAQVM